VHGRAVTRCQGPGSLVGLTLRRRRSRIPWVFSVYHAAGDRPAGAAREDTSTARSPGTANGTVWRRIPPAGAHDGHGEGTHAT
jgi:hypothetical protein